MKLHRYAILTIMVTIVMARMSQGRAENLIGIYFDPGANITCIEEPDFPFAGDAYLILGDVDCACGVSAWEASIFAGPGVFVSATSIGSGAINLGTAPDYVVGYESPLVGSENLVLAQFSIVAVDTGSIYMKEIQLPSLYGANGPLIACGCTDLQVQTTTIAYGGHGAPVAAIGTGNCPEENRTSGGGVGVRQKTWSDIKALYK